MRPLRALVIYLFIVFLGGIFGGLRRTFYRPLARAATLARFQFPPRKPAREPFAISR